jgi:ribA/ribD-fused uncharacterized protein
LSARLKGNDPLLNFYDAPFLWGLARSSEHLFQALKADNLGDFLYVLAAKDPAGAKSRGREITLRPDWEEVKWPLMVAVLILKFTSHPKLKKRLQQTYPGDIVEARQDPEWGIGRDGNGKNLMGFALSTTRSVFRKAKKL